MPKIHAGKFKDLNPCLEDFSDEGPLDDLEGDHLVETHMISTQMVEI